MGDRLTVAALHRMAKAVAGDAAVVTIVTHPQGGERYACWPEGCVCLPQGLVEDLAFPADGHYAITSKGLGGPVERKQFSLGFVVDRMLPLLDARPRVPVTPNGWLKERGPLTMRLLDRPGGHLACAVDNTLWNAWISHLDLPVWQAGDWILTWARDPTSRAVGLLTTVHHRYVPTPPETTP